MSAARDVQQVLARYVRAADNRDGAAMSTLFVPDGRVEIFHHQGGKPVPLGELEGAVAIGQAVSGMMLPHPPRGWSHHTTHDPIIEVSGDTATIDAQFIVYNTVGHEEPAGGWPKGARGAQGIVQPIEAGYYRASLRRVGSVWKIATHQIIHDLPVAVPRP